MTVGTTTALRAVVTDLALSLPAGLWCYRVDSRRLLPGGARTEGGGVFAWLRRTLRIALVYNQLRSVLPAEPQVIVGGGALLSSPAWQQIIADALGVPIAISTIPEASARGAALLALEALGLVPDVGQAPDGVAAVVMPNMEHHWRYQTALERQQRLYAQLVADR